MEKYDGVDYVPMKKWKNSLIERFLGKHMYRLYNVFVCLMLLLLSVVFIYTPGDLFVTQIIGQKSTLEKPVIWVV